MAGKTRLSPMRLNALDTCLSNWAGSPRPKPGIRAKSRFIAISLGEDNVPAGAYSGLGAINLARGDSGAALANYRKAVHKLTNRLRRAPCESLLPGGHLKEHRDTFIGLGRAAAALRLKPGADEPRLIEESFAAGQRAWATSASSALAKMTARLKASDTELGRSIRQLDALNDRIRALRQQDKDDGMARFKPAIPHCGKEWRPWP